MITKETIPETLASIIASQALRRCWIRMYLVEGDAIQRVIGGHLREATADVSRLLAVIEVLRANAIEQGKQIATLRGLHELLGKEQDQTNSQWYELRHWLAHQGMLEQWDQHWSKLRPAQNLLDSSDTTK